MVDQSSLVRADALMIGRGTARATGTASFETRAAIETGSRVQREYEVSMSADD